MYIRRIASMKPAAPDFLLMWDNAYCIHEFEGDYVEFPDILAECEKYGNADMVFEFASTSKVTLPGAGISCFACSEANMAYMEKLLTVQVISFDKVNQQRHVLYLKDKAHTLDLCKYRNDLFHFCFHPFASVDKRFYPWSNLIAVLAVCRITTVLPWICPHFYYLCKTT